MAPLIDLPSGYLLGGANEGRWLNVGATVPLLNNQSNRSYRVYSSTRLLYVTSGTRPFSQGAPCPETRFVRFARDSKAAVFAIGANWNALPRVPRIQSGGRSVYRAAVAQILRQKGFTRPQVQIDQIWRVDLDGDGREEVLLSATRKNSNGDPNSITADARAGDYSLVLLRRVTSKGISTQLLAGEFYPRAKKFNAPNFFRIAAVLDANGDGKMEVLLHGRYYEGDSASLFDGSGHQMNPLLESGCGA